MPLSGNISKNFEGLYLLLGPEVGRKEDFVKNLIEEIKKKYPSYEHLKFYAFETKVSYILSLAYNKSLFESKTIIELRSVEQIKNKGELSLIKDYVESNNSGSLIILESDEFNVERDLEELVPELRKKIFFEMYIGEKKHFIRNKLKGLEIEEDAIAELLDCVENDSASLEVACQRLMLNFSYFKDQPINVEDITSCFGRTKEEDVFDLLSAVFTESLESSLKVLQSVLLSKSNEAGLVMATLGWGFRRLAKLEYYIESGITFEDACKTLQIRSKTSKEDHLKAMQNYSKSECSDILFRIYEFERISREISQVESSLLASLLIVNIHSKKSASNNTLAIESEGYFL